MVRGLHDLPAEVRRLGCAALPDPRKIARPVNNLRKALGTGTSFSLLISHLSLLMYILPPARSNTQEHATMASRKRPKPTAPYLDPSVPINDRVRDLIARLTLDEKLGLVTTRNRPVERLGMPQYTAYGEGLHGLVHNGVATVFPQAIGLAATFDTKLMRRVGSAIADEARAKFHLLQRRFGRSPTCLNLWSPNVNIFRDPRWGRGQETYGEDPALTGIMGAAYVKGMQGTHPRYLKVAACAKHFAVHSGPEALRHEFRVTVSPKDLYETYLPAFKACVDAGVEIIMGAYNITNGESCCASPTLLKKILRDEWGYDGHVVSDGGAIQDFANGHKVTKTAAESSALAIRNGCNMEAGNVFAAMGDAIKQELVTEQEIDDAIFYHLRTRFRLGLFDPAETVPYTSIPADVINCTKHRTLSHEAAVKSVVLLKNSNGILPLGDGVRRILVTGPNAADQDVLLGNYFGVNNRMSTIMEAVVDRAGPQRVVVYRKGVVAHSKNLNIHEVVTGLARGSDVTIAVMGLNPTMEGEEFDPILSPHIGDRVDIGFPEHQIEFVKKLCSHKKPVVLVVTSGSAIAAPEIYEMVDAVIYAWYPGQEGGNAVADVLFGNASPSGRLPVTVPRSVEDLPAFEDYSMANRTYRYAKETPEFPFGFGLTYTTFAYSGLKLTRSSIVAGESSIAELTVKNTGKRAGEEVVQLYVTDLEASTRTPQYALKAFQRVALKPGALVRVKFAVTADMLELVNEDGRRVLEPGKFRVTIGGACPSARSAELGSAKPVSAVLSVRSGSSTR